MTKVQATKTFLECYPNARKEAKEDYCKVQLAWSFFVDGLCRDGEITQRQYNNWSCPFKGRKSK